LGRQAELEGLANRFGCALTCIGVIEPQPGLRCIKPGNDMSILAKLDLEKITPARLWACLEPDLRTSAARAVYGSDDAAHRAEADVAIAERLKFRPAAVRKLPVERRGGYVAGAVFPDDDLASTLLLALHVAERRHLLAAFLDALEIPHDDGMIDPDHELDPPSADDLRRASSTLFDSFDAGDVELYLAALVALDPHSWDGLSGVLRERRDA